MEEAMENIVQQVKTFCKEYNVDLEIETTNVSMVGDRKVEVIMTRRS